MECTQRFLEIPVHSHDDIKLLGISSNDMNGLYEPIDFVLAFRKMTNGMGVIGLGSVSHFKEHLCRIGFGKPESLVLSVTTYLLSKRILEDELSLYRVSI